MTVVTRRSAIAASVAALSSQICVRSSDAQDVATSTWSAAQLFLTYRQSQEAELKPVMEDILDVFTRRVLVPHDDAKSPATVRGDVFIELLDDKVRPHFWVFIHDESGSILQATGTDQLKAALAHLKSIARKRQAKNQFFNPAYPQGVPPVIELPNGVSTSLPVHHVA